MHRHHRQLLESIRAMSGKATQHTFSETYLGNQHPRFAINLPTMRIIARTWMSENKTMPLREFEAVLTSLVAGASMNEKMMTGLLLNYAPRPLRTIRHTALIQWLRHLEGWAEVDSVYAGNFSNAEIMLNWPAWENTIQKLSRSKNIAARRASLALLVKPVRESNSSKACTLGMMIIEQLQHEREILITKAISWLLRSMIKHHRHAVEEFIDEHTATLPAIALREVKMKLRTGKKTTR